MKRWFLLLIILLVACNNEQEIETAVNQTIAAQTPIVEQVAVTVVVAATAVATETVESPTAEVVPTEEVVMMNEVVQGDGYQGVIFQVDNAQTENALIGFISDYDAYRQATPAEVAALEAGLLDYLQSGYPEITDRLTDYTRQYVGFEREGTPFILINALCNTMSMDWQNHMIGVDDGGSCYFNLVYNVTDDAFSRLIVNGES